VTLSATLSAGQGKKALKLAGQTVNFTLGTATANATTDSTGKASVTLPAPPTAGTYPLSATFSGTCAYSASTVAKNFMVKRR
jgi:hypothetical protein